MRRERYEIRVKTILSELEADARDAAGSSRVEAFERAYEPLVELHTLLLGASHAKEANGAVGSWAVLPDILTAFERPVYEGWADTYRSIFLAAISAMEVTTRPIYRLCNLVQRLHGDELSTSPVEISENVLQLPPLMMYQLANWWTRKVEEQGTTEHGPQRMAVHLQETARMLLGAVLRGDKVAAEWLADVLSKWWGRTDVDAEPFTLLGKSDFVTVEYVKLDWDRVASVLAITDEDLRWTGGRVEGIQREVLTAAVHNLWTDTRLLVVELLLLLLAGDARPPQSDSLALYIALGLLNGKQWRSGGTLTDPLNTLTASRYLTAKIRQYAGDADVRGGYEALLSGLSSVKDAERPSMIGSRAYSYFGADDIASLREQQVLLLTVLSDKEWSAGESLRRQIGLWMEQQYQSIEVVRDTVENWLHHLENASDMSPELLNALLRLTGKRHDAAIGKQRAKLGIESLKAVVESSRTEALAAQPVDPARLDEIARFASGKGFAAGSGKFPIQLFGQVNHVREPREDFTLLRERVPKGELTRISMDQRAGNEEQYWEETLALHVGALLLSDVVERAEPHDLVVPDPASYWTALKAEASRFLARHTHPILILDNRARPEWVWQWTHGERESSYPRPDDLSVRRASARGDGYVCDFNEIEVYVGPVTPGYSLLLAREAFVSVAFREFEPRRYVDVSCDARADSSVLVDLKLRLSRKVEVGGVHLVRLRYGS